MPSLHPEFGDFGNWLSVPAALRVVAYGTDRQRRVTWLLVGVTVGVVAVVVALARWL